MEVYSESVNTVMVIYYEFHNDDTHEKPYKKKSTSLIMVLNIVN
jgi:hypothetical protein